MQRVFVLFFLILPCPALLAAELQDARRLLMTGKYAEAAEIYAKEKGPAASLGLARCQASQGKYDEAIQTLKAAGDGDAVQAELARLCFLRGDYTAARTHCDAAIRAKTTNLLARWVRAEVLRVDGKLDEANQAYGFLVNYYNANDVTDAESLHWIGLAAAQYARWNRLSDQFHFLVNELFPEILKADALYWPARYESGLLFLEKYNQAEASRELKAALEINPNAAEIHAALAFLHAENREPEEALASLERALQVNPRLLEAWLLKADLAWANFQPDEAASILRKQVLPVNPVCEEALGRLAAYLALRPSAGKDSEEFTKLTEQVTGRNPHAGEFFLALACWFDDRNRGVETERYLEEAARRMPQLIGPKNHLGLLAMRTGEETKARKLLKEAFDADPFNVRVSNSLEVLEVLDGYETIETDQFVLRFDPKKDKLLARCAAAYLEKAYPELCREFGYRPPRKPLVEIFREAKAAPGQQWFSARMIGLPYLGAVAASTGHIVAMASPNDEGRPSPFNWARVLRHELVHVVTLQQTGFNIPHWYTEALAVRAEDHPRPQKWNELLVRRVPEEKLFNLDSINFGFTRPKSSDDWQMAYCQSQLYVDYMLQGRDEAVIRKLLAAYAENRTTAEALPQVFGLSQEEFEKGYRDYLRKIVAGMPGLEPALRAGFAELVRAQKEKPDDPDRAAELAYAYFLRGASDEARPMAQNAAKQQPKHPLASYVLARLLVREGKVRQATELIEGYLDRAQPDLKSLNLLAALKLKAEKYGEAAELYRKGAKLDPQNLQWRLGLARVHLAAKDDAGLLTVLPLLAKADPDDLTSRKKLAELALAQKDFAAAEDWANQALEIDVTDADVHRMLAEALAARRQWPAAIEEYRIAVDLKPKEPYLRFALADALLQAGRPDEARSALAELLKLAPDYPGAQMLLESLKEDKK